MSAAPELVPAAPTRTRPYWHVDAKWLTGLALAAMLALTLLVNGLARVTAEEPAVETLTTALTVAFSGLDDSAPAVVPQEQVEELARAFYEGGSEGIAGFFPDPAMAEALSSQLATLALLSKSSHNALQGSLIFFGVIDLLLAGLLIFFSSGVGRLVSPGVVLLFSSLPGALIFSGLESATSDMAAGEGGSILGQIGGVILAPIAETLSATFSRAVVFSFGLFLAAILAAIVRRILRRARG